jgi:hypothetical protein
MQPKRQFAGALAQIPGGYVALGETSNGRHILLVYHCILEELIQQVPKLNNR